VSVSAVRISPPALLVVPWATRSGTGPLPWAMLMITPAEPTPRQAAVAETISAVFMPPFLAFFSEPLAPKPANSEVPAFLVFGLSLPLASPERAAWRAAARACSITSRVDSGRDGAAGSSGAAKSVVANSGAEKSLS
jgi:hypothetical protein